MTSPDPLVIDARSSAAISVLRVLRVFAVNVAFRARISLDLPPMTPH